MHQYTSTVEVMPRNHSLQYTQQQLVTPTSTAGFPEIVTSQF